MTEAKTSLKRTLIGVDFRFTPWRRVLKLRDSINQVCREPPWTVRGYACAQR